MIAKLISKFFMFILGLVASLVNILLLPLELLVNELVPDLHSWATSIESFLTTYIPRITYFLSWLGPMTKSVIILEISCISIFFTMYATYLTIQAGIYMITKIKSMFN